MLKNSPQSETVRQEHNAKAQADAEKEKGEKKRKLKLERDQLREQKRSKKGSMDELRRFGCFSNWQRITFNADRLHVNSCEGLLVTTDQCRCPFHFP